MIKDNLLVKVLLLPVSGLVMLELSYLGGKLIESLGYGLVLRAANLTRLLDLVSYPFADLPALDEKLR